VRVVLLTGPPGAGKTTVLTALMNRLEADDVGYAAVEVEALALVHPWPDDDAAFTHVELLVDSFRRRGYPSLLVSATIEDGGYLRRLLAALASDDVLLVRLEAPPERLRERFAQHRGRRPGARGGSDPGGHEPVSASGGREFAHLHPAPDYSLHAMLPTETATDAVEAGWAEPHPVALRGLIPPTAVMLDAPRDQAELDVIDSLVGTSHAFARPA
jgi:chloramphenicol 3-O-phosphotransferase